MKMDDLRDIQKFFFNIPLINQQINTFLKMNFTNCYHFKSEWT